jgi:hypothetical protein
MRDYRLTLVQRDFLVKWAAAQTKPFDGMMAARAFPVKRGDPMIDWHETSNFFDELATKKFLAYAGIGYDGMQNYTLNKENCNG